VSTFADEVSADLADAIADHEQSFTWSGSDYACVFNSASSSLIVSKALFQMDGTSRSYPALGATITVTGRKRQIKKMANYTIELSAGGEIETTPFIDDPSNPALMIIFGSFNA
jgi:hypothetical protein